MTKTTNKYSPEVRERAVRMVLDGVGQQRDWPLDGSFGPSPAEPVRSTDLMLRFLQWPLRARLGHCNFVLRALAA
ncbi:hypothetical protein NBRC116593_03550 [Sulfitobacter pacificus]